MNEKLITIEQIKALKEKLKQAEEVRNQASSELITAQDKMAAQICPHRVGDIIDCGGYSHKGKKMLVDGIIRARYSSDDWRVIGRVIKKDSTVGTLFYEFEGRNK